MLATTDVIIDHCLRAIAEEDTTSPVEMTRVQILELINSLYQYEIGERLRSIAAYSYDSSDAAHTITAGVGTLPTDFLKPAQVYDGDAPTDAPLTQIFDIEDKVANTAITSQYMLPDNANLWIFGQTPTNTVKMYYHKKPVALTDSASSSPTELKNKFHIGPQGVFEAMIKTELAKNQNSTYDMMDMASLLADLLDEIEYAHTAGKRDDSMQTIIDVWR